MNWVSRYFSDQSLSKVNTAESQKWSNRSTKLFLLSRCRTLESSTASSVESPSRKPRSTKALCFPDPTGPLPSNPGTQVKKNEEAGPSCCAHYDQHNHFHFLHLDAQTMMSDPVLLPTFFSTCSHGPYSGITFLSSNVFTFISTRLSCWIALGVFGFGVGCLQFVDGS